MGLPSLEIRDPHAQYKQYYELEEERECELQNYEKEADWFCFEIYLAISSVLHLGFSRFERLLGLD